MQKEAEQGANLSGIWEERSSECSYLIKAAWMKQQLSISMLCLINNSGCQCSRMLPLNTD